MPTAGSDKLFDICSSLTSELHHALNSNPYRYLIGKRDTQGRWHNLSIAADGERVLPGYIPVNTKGETFDWLYEQLREESIGSPALASKPRQQTEPAKRRQNSDIRSNAVAHSIPTAVRMRHPAPASFDGPWSVTLHLLYLVVACLLLWFVALPLAGWLWANSGIILIGSVLIIMIVFAFVAAGTQNSVAFILLLGVIAIAVKFTAGPTTGGTTPPNRSVTFVGKIDAWVMSQQFVRERLKSPSSASFGTLLGDDQSSDNVVTNIGGDRYRVNAWVESQNSFGAQIRTQFTCDLEHTGNGKWNCNALYFLE